MTNNKVKDFRANIIRVIRPILSNSKAVALVGFPHHWNVGDSTIWLGTVSVLKEMDIKVRYICEYRTYSQSDLRKLHSEGPILICGGGNFGDLYVNESDLRKKIITDFPDRTIVQLPQSIFFSSKKSSRDMKEIVDNHGSVKIIVREQQSLETAKKLFGSEIYMCPDMAMALQDNFYPNKVSRKVDLLALIRNDSESIIQNNYRTESSSIYKTDWPVENKSYLKGWSISEKTAWKFINWWTTRKPKTGLFTMKLAIYAAEKVSKARTEHASRLLNSGGVVISDRLHASIIASLICKKPTILINNSYGKNEAMYNEWLKHQNNFFFATTFESALKTAKKIKED